MRSACSVICVVPLLACAAERANSRPDPKVVDVPVATRAPSSDPPPADVPPADALRLANEARELASREAYAEAIPKFEASMKAGPNPALLYDIGRCYELMGKKLEAAETYEKYVSKNDLSHTDRMSMELRIKLLREGL